MRKLGNAIPALLTLAWVGRKMRLPVMMSYGFARHDKSKNTEIGINNRAGIERYEDQCCSGGCNEVFVFENWASYGPRH